MTAAPGGGFTEVADRVFVARYREWDVNVGLVLGRHGAVVIDTRASDVQGAQVLDDVRRLGRDVVVRHVVSTHVHFDHTFGNAAFETAIVHAHDNVGRTTQTAAEHIKALVRADPGAAPEHGYTERDAAEVLATVVRGPDRTFGDDCWPLEWADTLTSHLVQVSERTVVVPGHGRPVDEAFVTRQRDDVAAVAAVIRERRLGEVPLEEALRDPDPRLPYPLDHLGSAIRRGWDHLDPPTP